MPKDVDPAHRSAAQELSTDSILTEQFQRLETGLSSREVVDFMARIISGQASEGMRVVSLIGGVASGKSSLAQALVDKLKESGLRADSICTDDTSLYTRHERWKMSQDPGVTGLDLHDGELLNKKIKAIRQLSGNSVVMVPKYDPKTGDAVVVGEANFPHAIGQVDILIVEGDFDLVEKSDLLLYVEAPAAERRKIRIARDLNERTQVGDKTVTAEDIGASFDARQASQHQQFTAPTLPKADIVLQTDPTDASWKYDVYRSRQNQLA
jgi:uridine kinase